MSELRADEAFNQPLLLARIATLVVLLLRT